MKGRKWTALGLALILSLSLLAVPASAVALTDIASHWAKSYIEDMVDRGMVKGYEDNTYRPNKTLSMAEGLAFCARALQMDSGVSAKVLEKHADELDEILGDSQSWFRTEFALCLEAGILTKEEFEALAEDGALDQSRTMRKQDLARYLVRAMGLDLLADSQTSYPLAFQDTASISEENRPSVYLLNMYGIVTGDDKNVFDTAVTRGIMATMLSRVLDFKEERGVVTELADFTDYDWAAGVVEDIDDTDEEAVVLTLDNGFGEGTDEITLARDFVVYVNNMQSTLKSLDEGDYVRLVLDSRGKAEAIHIMGELLSLTGAVEEYTNESITLTVQKTTSTVTMDRFTMVEAGGDLWEPSELELGEDYTTATVLVDGRGRAVAVSLRGISVKKNGIFAGAEEIKDSDGLILKITGYDGVTQKYTMPADVPVTAGGKTVRASALEDYEGCDMTLRVDEETGLVVSAELDPEVTYIQGAIRGVTWESSTPSVGITSLETSKAKSYYVANDVKVTYEGKAVLFKNAKAGWFVTARMEDDLVTDLICYPDEVTVTGELLKVDFSAVPEVVLTVKGEDGAKVDFAFDIDDLPTMKRDGSRSSIDQLKVGDQMTVTIEYNEVTLMEAEPRTADLNGTILAISQTLAGDAITVKLEGGEEKVYTVSSAVVITKDGKKLALAGLKAGYKVAMTMEAGKLTAIEVEEAVAQSDKFTAKVLYVNKSAETVLFELAGGETLTVDVGSASMLEVSSGKELTVSSLVVGESLTVYGSYTTSGFKAVTILR